MPRITLNPTGSIHTVAAGQSLRDLLFAQGVEFPCGGQGTCGKCVIQISAGQIPAIEIEQQILGAERCSTGWRLGCHARATSDATITLGQWSAPILADDTPFVFTPRAGRGIAIDLGTTTVVAQLVDLTSGAVLAVKAALNAQAQCGADVVSRINQAKNNGSAELTTLIRTQLGGMIAELCGTDHQAVKLITVVGNTAMHQLFCGFDVAGLAQAPFVAHDDRLQVFTARELGWTSDASVRVLPCLGGFVGGDILAGILATGMHESVLPTVLIDLGTNGEIVVGNRDGLWCTATAAGPAFEGAAISIGMRAASGAIVGRDRTAAAVTWQVIGGEAARGLCGSGLVDAVAWGLDVGLMAPSGRIAAADRRLPLCDGIALNQNDIRQLQLAKGAIAAGVMLLLQRAGVAPAAVERVYLAGAFGNYVDRDSAQRIGLIPFDAQRQVVAAGNTALLGAKLALFRPDDDFTWLRQRVEHVQLDLCPGFMDTFADEMMFPA